MNRYKSYFVIGILTAVAGTFLFVIRKDISPDINTFISTTLVSGFSILLGIGFGLFAYLQNSKQVDFETAEKNSEIQYIRHEHEMLKLELLKLNDKNINSKVQQEEIGSLIKKIINQNLESDQLLELIERKFSKRFEEDQKLIQINKDFEVINRRIGLEIERLTRSANLNLVFGSVTTLMTVLFLGYEVLYNPVSFVEPLPLLSHYIPRVTLVIFVELFAFFFLKIYKTNLNDIKYFHNEKTNIDLKLIALKSAINVKNDTIIQFAIQELAKTERNFILKKDETTLEIEKDKLDLTNTKNVIELLKDLIKNK